MKKRMGKIGANKGGFLVEKKSLKQNESGPEKGIL